MSILSSLEVALALGLRHALEADHVAAVGTLIEPSARPRSITQVAAQWGLGHASTLLSMGALLILFRIRLPDRFETAAELIVASVLIWLGVRRLGVRGHSHGKFAPGAFSVGLLHGLSGSGPMVLLALTTLEQSSYALLYLLLVACGTLCGMVALAGVFALPLAKAVGGKHALLRGVELVAGISSVLAGIRLGLSVL